MTLVAIEGADGAGKATAAEHVSRLLRERGLRVSVISFPRYRATAGGFALGKFLSGEMPVAVTPHAAAVLYALDRFESRALIEDARRDNDVVVFDRYIASNLAYQAAKIAPGEVADLLRWIVDLETATFGLPVPDINIYLDTPLDTATRLIGQKRPRSYTDQAYDQHEADAQLQQRVQTNYRTLAAGTLVGPWAVVETTNAGTLRTPDDIAMEILAHAINLVSSRGV